ncbi:MAG TPA: thiosulfate oxidation carrier protein SoxY [Aquificaceae bacterium]|nr:thiosulfate oxidation carrier protein SoxY [Aquificaceae bacterium]HIQ48835.1 thiosulfate oxidation carrier protein SoxY [Aquifex aeolicus]
MKTRRELLKLTGVVAASLILSTGAIFSPAYAKISLEEALKKHLGVDLSAIKESNEIKVKAPSIAESGANVPIQVSASIPIEKVEALYIFVDKNPNPYVAHVEFTPLNGEVFFATRIKMGATSPVRAILKLKDGSYVMAYKEVKVTVGGCG